LESKKQEHAHLSLLRSLSSAGIPVSWNCEIYLGTKKVQNDWENKKVIRNLNSKNYEMWRMKNE